MKYFLAPMADITDRPFREVCYSAGADICYSEMISAKAVVFGNHKTVDMTFVSENEPMTFLQLFGSDPEAIEKSIGIIEEKRSFYGFDINMGCPVKKVIKTGAGSALMKDPQLVREIVKRARRATKKPLSVKIRKGFETENALEIARIAEGEGADIVVVHPRLRSEMFMGKSDFDLSVKIAGELSVKVVHSGDIRELSDQESLLSSDLYGIMVGRGILGAPWLFRELSEKRLTTEDERRKLVELHFSQIVSAYSDFKAKLLLRKHAAWYSKGRRGGSEFRSSLFLPEMEGEELVSTIENFFEIKIG